MERRTFLRNVATSVTGIFGGAVVAPFMTTATLHPETSSLGKAIGKTTTVKVGGSATFSAPMPSANMTKPVKGIIIQPTKGVFKAFASACPHQGCPVGYVKAQQSFMCPCHHSTFSSTGALTGGPAPSGLVPFQVQVVKGVVYVR